MIKEDYLCKGQYANHREEGSLLAEFSHPKVCALYLIMFKKIKIFACVKANVSQMIKHDIYIYSDNNWFKNKERDIYQTGHMQRYFVRSPCGFIPQQEQFRSAARL